MHIGPHVHLIIRNLEILTTVCSVHLPYMYYSDLHRVVHKKESII